MQRIGKSNPSRQRAPRRQFLPLLLLAVVCASCVARTDLMDYRPEEGFAVSPPRPDTALVIFMRPGRMAGMVSSTVFDEVALVAVLMDYTYGAYETAPGRHRFMVLGEAADFMDAELDPGKVYFARVTPRFGVWRARFSLQPLTPHDEEWTDLQEWISGSYLVSLNAEGRTWAQENAPSIQEKHDAYLAKWLEKDERPALYREDGVRFADLPVH